MINNSRLERLYRTAISTLYGNDFEIFNFRTLIKENFNDTLGVWDKDYAIIFEIKKGKNFITDRNIYFLEELIGFDMIVEFI